MSYMRTAGCEKSERRNTSSLYTTMACLPHHLWLKWNFRQTVIMKLLITDGSIFCAF